MPGVVPSQVDVLPADRRHVLKERIWKADSILPGTFLLIWRHFEVPAAESFVANDPQRYEYVVDSNFWKGIDY